MSTPPERASVTGAHATGPERVLVHLLDALRRAIGGPHIETGMSDLASARSHNTNPLDAFEWLRWHAAAEAHLVTPILALVPPRDLPAEMLAEMQSHARDLARYNLHVMAEVKRMLEEFGRQGIETLLYKGPVAAVDAFGALKARRFVDVDLLLRASDFERAAELLQRHGYAAQHALGSNARHLYLATYGQLPYDDAAKTMIVELHSALMPAYLPMQPPYDAMFARKRSLVIADTRIDTLDVEDHLLLLCMHGTKECWPHLRSVADVAGIIRRHDTIDWRRVTARADEAGCTGALALGVSLAGWLLRDTALADGVRKTPHVDAVAARVRERLCSTAHAPSSIDEFRIVFPVLDSLRERMRFTMHHLTGHTLADWERWPGGDRWLGLTRVARPARIALKYAKAALLPRR